MRSSTIFYWSVSRLRDRVAVKTDSRHVVQELPDGKFEMKIKSALKSDGGVYTCKIINEYGVKQADCKLEVSGETKLKENLSIVRGKKLSALFIFTLCT